MSNLLFLIIFIVVCFTIVSIAIAFFKGNALFTLAIGCVIGANVYNIGSYPIQIGNLTFGMDGVIYCVFLFCLLVTYIDDGKKSMKLVLYTALFSIFFTAMLSFFGTYLQNGKIDSEQIWATLSYVFSIIATYVACICMVALYEKLKSKKCNIYVNFALCMAVGNITNSLIYFGFTFLTAGASDGFFIPTFFGSAIIKIVSALICLLVFYFYEKYWNKKTNNM